ncbi:MAG: D-tyrosyl-tRNA(Tyr) deacylase [Dehalococcoidia bacterium]|nr:D-tyrosyl-tRNA(Tyr) deacylase [Dehalococcoidia bacterium]
MRVVIQRVSRASARVDAEIVGEIGQGALILAGVKDGDTEDDVRYLAGKIPNLRIIADGDKHFESSVMETGGSALVVSQFTLYADTRKGRRPSFLEAAQPAEAERLYELLVTELRGQGLTVETGRFGAIMDVELVNDGPVTIIIDSADRQRARRG